MVIIGNGRVGGALHQAATAKGLDCSLVSRDDGWEAVEGPPGDPILLAVRNDDLLDVVANVPSNRQSDLVFIQNGAVRDFLSQNTLGACTRGLLFFAVPKRGAPISPGATSPFTGPHATAMARFLGQIGLQAQHVDWARFLAYEFEKLTWNTAFGLLCERFDSPVGQVMDDHMDVLDELVRELSHVGRAAMNVDLPHDYLMKRLCDYARSIEAYQGAVKDWRWRNGWFVTTARTRNIETPVHHRLLVEIGREHLLNG